MIGSYIANLGLGLGLNLGLRLGVVFPGAHKLPRARAAFFQLLNELVKFSERQIRAHDVVVHLDTADGRF